MEEQINIKDAAGKTIARVVRSSAMVSLVYGDGTFSCLVSQGDENGSEIRDHDIDDWTLLELGFIDRAEWERRIEDRRMKQAEFDLAQERKYYEKLKAKFEAAP